MRIASQTTNIYRKYLFSLLKSMTFFVFLLPSEGLFLLLCLQKMFNMPNSSRTCELKYIRKLSPADDLLCINFPNLHNAISYEQEKRQLIAFNPNILRQNSFKEWLHRVWIVTLPRTVNDVRVNPI